MTRRRTDAGFTLVEVLVSLFIFSLISAGTLGAMFQTFAAKERLDAATSRLSDVAAMRSIVRADMDGIVFRAARDGVGGTERYIMSSDGDSMLTFTRLGRLNPGQAKRGQAERVRYIFRDDALIRESLPHENPAALDLWKGRVLLDNLQSAKLTYISQGQSAILEEEEIFLMNVPLVTDIEMDGAIKLVLTDQTGVETIHLFEMGQ